MRSVFSTVLAVSLVWAAMAGAATTPPNAGKISDCESFRHWLEREPASAGEMGALSRHMESPYIRRHAHEELSLDAYTRHALGLGNDTSPNMLHTYSHVGGGGCLSGFYDARHNIAGIVDEYDTADEFLLFLPHTPPVGLPPYDLSHAASYRGVRLGMTRRQLERIEGIGNTVHAGPALFEQYRADNEWKDKQSYDGEMTFMLEHGVVTSIDYFWGM